MFRFFILIFLSLSKLYSSLFLDALVGEALQKASIHSRPEKVVISAATGDIFRKELARMFYTCHRTNPDCLLVLLMINWSEEEIVEFQEAFKEYPIVYARIDQPITTPEDPEVRYQVFRLKASLFKHAYLQIGPPLLWIDADVVVLNSLDSIFSKLKEADFSASNIRFNHIEQKFVAQAVGIGNGPLAGVYFDRVCHHAYRPDLKRFQDQLGMYFAYTELLPQGLVHQQMTLRENSYYYFPGVTICAYYFQWYLKTSGMQEGLDQILIKLSA